MNIVIFGGTGDLAKNKLFKALHHLETQGLIHEDANIIGFSRKQLSDQEYREIVKEYIGENVSEVFLNRISYFSGDLSDIESYKKLEKYLKQKDDEKGLCSSKLYYLAVPPALYENSFVNLSKSGLANICSGADKWTRILVEKPFGNNVESAQKLDALLTKLFKEDQIYRIDHYLAKEAVQNLITFRFANSIFEPLWNNEYIESVNIELFESRDVSGRGAFFDGIGALRDVGQNHILQMLALIAMDEPKSMRADDIRDARAEILKKIKLYSRDSKECLTRAQYLEYKETEGVAKDSDTETFFRLKLKVDNKKWKGVPFIIESGKALDKNLTRITVNFKQVESIVCDGKCDPEHKNKIVFEIQPDNKITVRFWSKKPALHHQLIKEDLSFDYSSREERSGDAYEKVLHDALEGDLTLFNSSKEVSAEWNVIDPILKGWNDLPLIEYQKRSKAETINYKDN